MKIKFEKRELAETFIKELGHESEISEADGVFIVAYQDPCVPSQCPEKVHVEAKGDCSNVTKEELERMRSYFASEFDCLYRVIDRLTDRLYEHQKGHIPNAKTNAQMKKFLEVLELEDEYEVRKQEVVVADNSGASLTAIYEK